MEIKTNIGEVLNINQTLQQIIDGCGEVEPLFKFKLLGIMKVIEPHITNFSTIRNEMIIKYGEKTEDGKVQILPDNKDAFDSFNSELSKLINSEVSINIEKLKPSDIFNRGVGAELLIGLYSIIEA